MKVKDNEHFLILLQISHLHLPINGNASHEKLRRIIRVAGLPVSATITSGLDSYLPTPEQTHPEDLSLAQEMTEK